MTEPDNFILRWARLKRRSRTEHEIETAGIGSAIESKETVLVASEATAARPRIDAAADQPVDLSDLPSIEAITASTDVRGFLQTRVPNELTRAALRKAWTSDPAIRNFIGIAENQWDFNDPNAIPGFGPLEMTGNETDVLAQFVGKLDEVYETCFQSSASTVQLASSVTKDERSVMHEVAQLKIAELPSADTGVSRHLNEQRVAEDKLKNAAAAENCDHFRNRHRHGSAWPR
jgi:hypothetical protein